MRIHSILVLWIVLFAPLQLLHAESVTGVKCGTAAYASSEKVDHRVQYDLPLEQITPSNHFMLHYTLSGQDAATQTYVDSAAAILDYCWSLQVDSLGYPAPPGGDDGRVHVYLQDLPTLYGYTVPSNSSGTNLSSYMVLDNDYMNPAHGSKGFNGLRVTAAHEFFHAIHFTMRLDTRYLYIYEWFSTWMEEVAYPQVNDYLFYLPAFFNYPELSIRTMNGVREYATGLLPMLCADLAGNDVVSTALIAFQLDDSDPFEELLFAMADEGYEREEVAQTFVSWLLLSGTRDVGTYGYVDGGWFPSMALSEGNCGDQSWCGEVGEWGFIGGLLPGGVQGLPRLRIDSTEPATGVVSVVNGFEVESTGLQDQASLNGSWGVAGFISLAGEQQTLDASVEPDRTGLPVSITISPAWPNPGNGGFNWQVRLDRPGTVAAIVYSVLGREVATLSTNTGSRRQVRLSWDGRDRFGHEIASGMYILRAVAGNASATTRFVVVR